MDNTKELLNGKYSLTLPEGQEIHHTIEQYGFEGTKLIIWMVKKLIHENLAWYWVKIHGFSSWAPAQYLDVDDCFHLEDKQFLGEDLYKIGPKCGDKPDAR